MTFKEVSVNYFKTFESSRNFEFKNENILSCTAQEHLIHSVKLAYRRGVIPFSEI